MTLPTTLALAGVLLASTGSVVDADTIIATRQGWCNASRCNTSDFPGVSPLQNTFAGSSEGAEFRDWFAFQVPPSVEITTATLNIWNDYRNFTESSTATFELRNATNISFGGLLGSTTLGSINVREADEGASRFIAITLNSDAVRLLNAAQGGQFLFGGVVTPFLPATEVQIFGSTFGPPAAFLAVSRQDTAPVPEPASLVLLGTGLAGVVMRTARRRRDQLR